MSMVNVTVSLPDDVASRAAAAAADRGVTVEQLASEALEVFLGREPASESAASLSFVGLGDAANGFSARAAEARLEAEGFEPSRSS
jgi:predicted transcriptional regulator